MPRPEPQLPRVVAALAERGPMSVRELSDVLAYPNLGGLRLILARGVRKALVTATTRPCSRGFFHVFALSA